MNVRVIGQRVGLHSFIDNAAGVPHADVAVLIVALLCHRGVYPQFLQILRRAKDLPLPRRA